MDWISKLEKHFGSWAIPNLTNYLLVAQIIGALLLLGGYTSTSDLVLVGGLVQVGDWTRLFSFMMIPKSLHPIWIIFSLYIFYLMGSSLEREWGAFRYNLFVLCGYLLTIAAAFIIPAATISNIYFLGAVFLAFATLFPNFELLLFFVLPVKVKWLGILAGVFYLLILLAGPPGERVAVGAALLNYALFFGAEFLAALKAGQRRKAFQAEREVAAAQPRHQCAECGESDVSAPAKQFRYCSTCGNCFCEEHLEHHQH